MGKGGPKIMGAKQGREGQFVFNKPKIGKIVEIFDENEAGSIKTFILDIKTSEQPLVVYPGQFMMVWIPGVDEIPMSISSFAAQFNTHEKIYENRVGISVQAVGEATKHLHELTIGEQLGIRGPFGNGYSIKPGTAVVVGGGVGMASLKLLIENLIQKKQETELENLIVIEGCRDEKELPYTEWLGSCLGDSEQQYCTDNGSCGYHGFTSDYLDSYLQTLKEQGKDLSKVTVYSCGPELMLHSVFEICERYGCHLQASLERWMRCGFGLCGLCALEPTGLLVCKNGPVFSETILRNVEDFGNYHRDVTGRKTEL